MTVEKLTQESQTTEELATSVRQERNRRLFAADCKINVLEDSGYDASMLRMYRQALRNIPTQVGFPQTVEWPVEP